MGLFEKFTAEEDGGGGSIAGDFILAIKQKWWQMNCGGRMQKEILWRGTIELSVRLELILKMKMNGINSTLKPTH